MDSTTHQSDGKHHEDHSLLDDPVPIAGSLPDMLHAQGATGEADERGASSTFAASLDTASTSNNQSSQNNQHASNTFLHQDLDPLSSVHQETTPGAPALPSQDSGINAQQSASALDNSSSSSGGQHSHHQLGQSEGRQY